jgi:hypothetical protein
MLARRRKVKKMESVQEVGKELQVQLLPDVGPASGL